MKPHSNTSINVHKLCLCALMFLVPALAIAADPPPAPQPATPPPATQPAPPPASQPAIPPAPPTQPDLDKVLADLAKIDPKLLEQRLTALNARAKQLTDENTALQTKIQHNTAEIAKVHSQIQWLDAIVKARHAMTAPQPKPPATKPPPTLAPAMSSPPPAAPAPKPAPAAAAPVAMKTFVTYQDNVLPILSRNCLGCHNPDKTKGGLILASYDELRLGGSSGEVVRPGAPDQSRLFRLVSHLEEPHMPPNQPKLADADLDVIRQWIADGALRDAKSAPTATAQATASMQPAKTAPPPTEADAITMTSVSPAELKINAQINPLPATALAASPVADLLAVGANRQILLFKTQSRELLRALDFAEGRMEKLAFTADGSTLLAAGGIAGESGAVITFDVQTGHRAGQFDRLYDTALSATVSADGSYIAIGSANKKVRIFDGYTGTKLHEFLAHNDWIEALAFSPDSLLLATADRAGALFVWETDTGRQAYELRGFTTAITALAFRPDSQALAACSLDGTVRVWEMENGQQIAQWSAHPGGALDIAFAPDARLVTCGVDGLASLWQQDGKKIRDYPKQNDWLYRVAFTAGAKQLAVGSWSGDVLLFDTEQGTLLGTLSTAPKPPTPQVAAANQ